MKINRFYSDGDDSDSWMQGQDHGRTFLDEFEAGPTPTNVDHNLSRVARFNRADSLSRLGELKGKASHLFRSLPSQFNRAGLEAAERSAGDIHQLNRRLNRLSRLGSRVSFEESDPNAPDAFGMHQGLQFSENPFYQDITTKSGGQQQFGTFVTEQVSQMNRRLKPDRQTTVEQTTDVFGRPVVRLGYAGIGDQDRQYQDIGLIQTNTGEYRPMAWNAANPTGGYIPVSSADVTWGQVSKQTDFGGWMQGKAEPTEVGITHWTENLGAAIQNRRGMFATGNQDAAQRKSWDRSLTNYGNQGSSQWLSASGMTSAQFNIAAGSVAHGHQVPIFDRDTGEISSWTDRMFQDTSDQIMGMTSKATGTKYQKRGDENRFFALDNMMRSTVPEGPEGFYGTGGANTKRMRLWEQRGREQMHFGALGNAVSGTQTISFGSNQIRPAGSEITIDFWMTPVIGEGGALMRHDQGYAVKDVFGSVAGNQVQGDIKVGDVFSHGQAEGHLHTLREGDRYRGDVHKIDALPDYDPGNNLASRVADVRYDPQLDRTFYRMQQANNLANAEFKGMGGMKAVAQGVTDHALLREGAQLAVNLPGPKDLAAVALHTWGMQSQNAIREQMMSAALQQGGFNQKQSERMARTGLGGGSHGQQIMQNVNQNFFDMSDGQITGITGAGMNLATSTAMNWFMQQGERVTVDNAPVSLTDFKMMQRREIENQRQIASELTQKGAFGLSGLTTNQARRQLTQQFGAGFWGQTERIEGALGRKLMAGEEGTVFNVEDRYRTQLGGVNYQAFLGSEKQQDWLKDFGTLNVSYQDWVFRAKGLANPLSITSQGTWKGDVEQLNALAMNQPGMYQRIMQQAQEGNLLNSAHEVVLSARANQSGPSAMAIREGMNILDLTDKEKAAEFAQAYGAAQAEVAAGFADPDKIHSDILAKAAIEKLATENKWQGNVQLGQGQVFTSLRAAAENMEILEGGRMASGYGESFRTALEAQLRGNDPANAVSSAQEALADLSQSAGIRKRAGRIEVAGHSSALAQIPVEGNRIMVDEAYMMDMINQAGLTKEQGQMAMRRYHEGNMDAVMTMFPQAFQEQAFAGMQLLSPEQVKGTPLEKYVMGRRGFGASSAAAAYFAKDFDGDFGQIIVNMMNDPVRKDNDQEFLRKARQSRGVELQDRLNKMMRNASDYAAANLPGGIGTYELGGKALPKTPEEMSEQYDSGRDAKTGMAVTYKPWVTRLKHSYRSQLEGSGLADPKKEAIAESMGLIGSHFYQRSLDLDPSIDPSGKQIQRMVTSNYIALGAGEGAGSYSKDPEWARIQALTRGTIDPQALSRHVFGMATTLTKEDALQQFTDGDQTDWGGIREAYLKPLARTLIPKHSVGDSRIEGRAIQQLERIWKGEIKPGDTGWEKTMTQAFGTSPNEWLFGRADDENNQRNRNKMAALAEFIGGGIAANTSVEGREEAFGQLSEMMQSIGLEVRAKRDAEAAIKALDTNAGIAAAQRGGQLAGMEGYDIIATVQGGWQEGDPLTDAEARASIIANARRNMTNIESQPVELEDVATRITKGAAKARRSGTTGGRRADRRGAVRIRGGGGGARQPSAGGGGATGGGGGDSFDPPDGWFDDLPEGSHPNFGPSETGPDVGFGDGTEFNGGNTAADDQARIDAAKINATGAGDGSGDRPRTFGGGGGNVQPEDVGAMLEHYKVVGEYLAGRENLDEGQQMPIEHTRQFVKHMKNLRGTFYKGVFTHKRAQDPGDPSVGMGHEGLRQFLAATKGIGGEGPAMEPHIRRALASGEEILAAESSRVVEADYEKAISGKRGSARQLDLGAMARAGAGQAHMAGTDADSLSEALSDVSNVTKETIENAKEFVKAFKETDKVIGDVVDKVKEANGEMDQFQESVLAGMTPDQAMAVHENRREQAGVIEGQMSMLGYMGAGKRPYMTDQEVTARQWELLGQRGSRGMAARRKEREAGGLLEDFDIGGIQLGERGQELAGSAYRFGQGIRRRMFGARMAHSMLLSPALQRARAYESAAASEGVSMMGAGVANFGDLMSGEYGNIRRRMGIASQREYAMGQATYQAFAPIMNATVGAGVGSAGAMLGGIGQTALGVGVTAGMATGNAAVGAIAGLATAGAGILGYASENADNYLATGRLNNAINQQSPGGNILQRGSAALGQFGENAAGVMGNAARNINMIMNDPKEWGRQRAYGEIKDLYGAGFAADQWLSEANRQDMSSLFATGVDAVTSGKMSISEAYNRSYTTMINPEDPFTQEIVQAGNQALAEGREFDTEAYVREHGRDPNEFVRKLNIGDYYSKGEFGMASYSDWAGKMVDKIGGSRDEYTKIAMQYGRYDPQGDMLSDEQVGQILSGQAKGIGFTQKEQLAMTRARGSGRQFDLSYIRGQIDQFDERYAGEDGYRNYMIDTWASPMREQTNTLLRRAGMRELDEGFFNQYADRPGIGEQAAEMIGMRAQLKDSNESFFANTMTDEFNTSINNLIEGGQGTEGRRRFNVAVGMQNQYTQWTSRGMSETQAGAIVGDTANIGDSRITSMVQAMQRGDRYAMSRYGAAMMGDSRLKTIDMQTGMGKHYGSITGDELSTLREDDQYGLFDLTDEEAALGTKGLQAQLTMGAREMSTYQYEQQVAGRELGQSVKTGFSQAGGAQFDASGFMVNLSDSTMDKFGELYEKYFGEDAKATKSQYEIADAMTKLTRERQQFSMSQQETSLGINQEMWELQGRQFYEKAELSQRRFDTQVAHQTQQMQRGRSRQVTQEGWQREDWSFSRSQSEVNFAWQQEDFDRNIRYARGRQRRDLMREQERSVVRNSMQMSRSDTQRGRLGQQEQWSEESYEAQKEYFQQTTRMTQEQMDMQIRHFEERRALEEQLRDMNKERFEQEKQWMEEQWGLEDERRILDREYAEINLAMSEEMQTRTREYQMEVERISTSLQAITQIESERAAYLQMQVETGQMAVDVMEAFNTQLAEVPQQLSEVAGGLSGLFGSVGSSIAGMFSSVNTAPQSSSSGNTSGMGPYMSGGYVAPVRGFAEGGYTGSIMANQVAGVVHGGEFVVPQQGALVSKDPGTNERLDKMIAVLERIASQPSRVNAVINTSEKQVDVNESLSSYDRATNIIQ